MTYPGVVDSGIDILLYKKFVVVVGKSEVKSKYYFLNEMKCEKSLKNIPKILDLAHCKKIYEIWDRRQAHRRLYLH